MRPLVVCGVVVCVALAGCSVGPLGDFQGGGEGATTPASTPTVPYEHLDGATVVERHRAQLRAAGNATRHVYSRIGVPERPYANSSRKETAYIDFTTDPPRRHVVEGDGSERWVGEGRNVSKGPDGRFGLYSGLGVFADGIQPSTVDTFTYRDPEPVTRNGRTLYRYRAEGVGALSPQSEPYFGTNTTVKMVNVSLLARSDGVLVETRLHLVVERDGLTVIKEGRVAYASIGETTVTRPDWYEAAIDELGPFAGERTTVTRRSDRLNATLTVTGAAEDVADRFGARTDLRYSLNAQSLEESDAITAARVSCIPYASLPDTFERAELTVRYPERYVTNGDESNLTMYRYNRTIQTMVQVEGTAVNATSNEATARIDQSGVYAILHTPTWAESFGSRDTPASATGAPACE